MDLLQTSIMIVYLPVDNCTGFGAGLSKITLLLFLLVVVLGEAQDVDDCVRQLVVVVLTCCCFR